MCEIARPTEVERPMQVACDKEPTGKMYRDSEACWYNHRRPCLHQKNPRRKEQAGCDPTGLYQHRRREFGHVPNELVASKRTTAKCQVGGHIHIWRTNLLGLQQKSEQRTIGSNTATATSKHHPQTTTDTTATSQPSWHNIGNNSIQYSRPS